MRVQVLSPGIFACRVFLIVWLLCFWAYRESKVKGHFKFLTLCIAGSVYFCVSHALPMEFDIATEFHTPCTNMCVQEFSVIDGEHEDTLMTDM